MEVLPPSLSYSASKNAMRYNRFLCRPVGSDSANPGDTVRIQLPSKSDYSISRKSFVTHLQEHIIECIDSVLKFNLEDKFLKELVK